MGRRVMFGQARANLLVMETLKDEGSEILDVAENHPSLRILPHKLKKTWYPWVESSAIARFNFGHLFNFFGIQFQHLVARLGIDQFAQRCRNMYDATTQSLDSGKRISRRSAEFQ